MSKNRNYRNNTVYPEDKDGGIKDANKKLRSQIKQLKKTIKLLESEIKTLKRANSKNINHIENVCKEKSLEELIEIANKSNYKETERGRKEAEKKCPKCNKTEKEGFSILVFKNFVLKSCSCGYKKRSDTNEGIKRNKTT